MRRVVRVAVDSQLLQHVITTGTYFGGFRVEDGLPVGARLVRSTFDEAHGVTSLYFEHESFAEVEPGTEPPQLTPQVWLAERP